MRFSLQFLLLYVMPCIAIAGTMWTLSEVTIPAGAMQHTRDIILLYRLGMCMAIACWWIVCVKIALVVRKSVRRKRPPVDSAAAAQLSF